MKQYLQKNSNKINIRSLIKTSINIEIWIENNCANKFYEIILTRNTWLVRRVVIYE